MNEKAQPKSGWLVCQSQVLSSLNIADTPQLRRRGLIGENDVEIPLLIDSCRWIHTFGVKCVIDVAYLDDQLQVVKIKTVKPMRLTLPVLGACHVLESSAGSFAQWGLLVGHKLEVRQS